MKLYSRWEVPDNDIQQRLKELRSAIGATTQEELATKLGVSRAVIANIERGDREPSRDLLLRIVTKCNINGHWLLTGTGPIFIDSIAEGNPTSQPGIPARLREFREALGLDQKTFANIVGTSEFVLDEMETGKIEPDPDILDLLTTRYQANPDWLLNGTEPMRIKPHYDLTNAGSKAPEKLKRLVHDIETRTFKAPLVIDSNRNIALVEEPVYTFPIEAEIAAGPPLENDDPESLGSVSLPQSALRGHDPASFTLFRINGRSMEPFVLHNDLCLVRRVPDWYSCEGQIVAVQVGYGITLKQLMMDDANKVCLLLSFNREFAPIVLGENTNAHTTLLGKLYMLFRSYENWRPRVGTDPVILTPVNSLV
jgi:transcriptional regulator with XRE-family HTH domain